MLRLFWSDDVEGFYDTGGDHESLIVRPRNLFDNAVPCGSSVAIDNSLAPDAQAAPRPPNS